MTKQKAGCLSVFLPFLRLFVGEEKEPKKLPYAKRDDFLSPSEMSFYKVLTQTLGDEFIICPKVGLKDVFFVKSRDNREFTIYNNKISRKHVDFLLCRPDKMEPVLGIELDDSSHRREDRLERDIFVDDVFNAAGLPLVRFRNKQSYALSEIREKIENALKQGKEYTSSQNTTETNGLQQEVPICPKCNIPMVLRAVKRGNNKGKEFYGCINFPKCREIREIEGKV
jgi:very-short-patch-repair endonuclease